MSFNLEMVDVSEPIMTGLEEKAETKADLMHEGRGKVLPNMIHELTIEEFNSGRSSMVE